MPEGIIEASHGWPRPFAVRLLLHISQLLFRVSRDYPTSGVDLEMWCLF